MIVHGIDFSGGAAPWRAKVARPTVWIATVETGGARPRLTALRPVQDLPGGGRPFDRLVGLLRAGGYAAAGIDAPFSLPARHLPGGTHRGLLAAVAALGEAPDRPFPRGADLVALAEGVAPLDPGRTKPFRRCEAGWGVSTRSTLWNGPRGGAPFAAACLALLARAGRPAWPWSGVADGLLVEVFPAAQLRCWGWPHAGYGSPDQAAARRGLVGRLRGRIDLAPPDAELMEARPDALDAVLASFGAAAAATGCLARAPCPAEPEEGWIAVHRA